MHTRLLKALFCLLALTFVSQSHSFTVFAPLPKTDTTPYPLAGRFVGHEEISRQAILMTKYIMIANNKEALLTDELMAHMSDTQKLPFGWEAFQSENPLILGNRAADKPDNEKWPIDIREINEFPAIGEVDSLLKWGGARSFHFTLNKYQLLSPMTEVPKRKLVGEKIDPEANYRVAAYAGETDQHVYFDTAKEACEDAQDRIILFTMEGLEALAARAKAGEGDKAALLNKALFSFGVATHIIQDSFSPSHSFRANSNLVKPKNPAHPEMVNYDVIDVCYYDQEIGHIIDPVKEGLLPALWQDFSQADNFILRPDERYEAFKARQELCAHGKTDHDDFIWVSTQKQSDIIDANMDIGGENGWEMWEAELYADDSFVWDLALLPKTSRAPKRIQKFVAGRMFKSKMDDINDAGGPLAYCQQQRRKSSNFSAFFCLKHNARLARMATVKYFLTLFDHIELMRMAAIGMDIGYDINNLDGYLATPDAMNEIISKLRNVYFSNYDEEEMPYFQFGVDRVMSQGVMRCEKLSDDRFIFAADGQKWQKWN